MNSETTYTYDLKLTIGVPESHADIIRKKLGELGVGKIRKYDYCSFSIKGTGRFRPMEGVHPAIGKIGKIGKIEKVKEELIQTICPKYKVKKVIDELKKIHPYEEMSYDVYPLIEVRG